MENIGLEFLFKIAPLSTLAHSYLMGLPFLSGLLSQVFRFTQGSTRLLKSTFKVLTDTSLYQIRNPSFVILNS